MSEVKRFRADWRHVVETEFDDAQYVLISDYQEIEIELNRMLGAAKEMLRIAGIASQGSNAYNRAIVNLHETVTACAKSRARSAE